MSISKIAKTTWDLTFYLIALAIGWVLTMAFLTVGALVIGMVVYGIGFLLAAGHPISD